MYKFLGPGVSISRIHGQARKVGKFIIFPMFHSAAALRSTEVMNLFLADFSKLKDLVDKKDSPVIEPEKTKTEQLQLV